MSDDDLIFKMDKLDIFDYVHTFEDENQKQISKLKQDIHNLKREITELKSKVKYLELKNKKIKY